MLNNNYKKCPKCNLWKEKETEFYKNKHTKDGVTSYCKECLRKRQLEYRDKHVEELNEYNRNWRKKNKEKTKGYFDKFVEENPERIKSNQRKWRQSNPDKLKQYNQTRNQNKKHKIKKKEWIACKEYFGNSCAYCGLHESEHYRSWGGEIKKIDLHKEHVEHDGANDLSNCVPSCQSCNSSKGENTLENWYNEENKKFSSESLEKIYKWLNIDYKKYIIL